MSLFGWLFGAGGTSAANVLPDRIWLNESAKFVGIASEVKALAASLHPPAAVLLVAHFEECFARMQPVAESLHCPAIPVATALAGELPRSVSPGGMHDAEAEILILVAERHPLRANDDAIVAFSKSTPVASRVRFHVSLDDALLSRFAGNSIQQMLRNLGMMETEVIESHLVGRRLTAAQLKIAQRATGDRPAHSAAEWLELNCPGL